MKNLKLLPLLVFVAMLAFSVRLVEVIAGVSSLSGAAYAESAEHKNQDSEDHSAEGGGGLVFEDEDAHEEVKEVKEDMHEPDHEPVMWRDPTDEDPSYDIVKGELFVELSARRKDLDSRERGLQTREALLQAAEQELDRKFQELSQLRKEIESLLKTQSDEESARVQSLVKIYEGMKPKQAARIFDTLDLDILVSVVSSMSERKLSPVLAAMNPERARTITIMLAEQKQLPSLPSAR